MVPTGWVPTGTRPSLLGAGEPGRVSGHVGPWLRGWEVLCRSSRAWGTRAGSRRAEGVLVCWVFKWVNVRCFTYRRSGEYSFFLQRGKPGDRVVWFGSLSALVGLQGHRRVPTWLFRCSKRPVAWGPPACTLPPEGYPRLRPWGKLVVLWFFLSSGLSSGKHPPLIKGRRSPPGVRSLQALSGCGGQSCSE